MRPNSGNKKLTDGKGSNVNVCHVNVNVSVPKHNNKTVYPQHFVKEREKLPAYP